MARVALMRISSSESSAISAVPVISARPSTMRVSVWVMAPSTFGGCARCRTRNHAFQRTDGEEPSTADDRREGECAAQRLPHFHPMLHGMIVTNRTRASMPELTHESSADDHLEISPIPGVLRIAG